MAKWKAPDNAGPSVSVGGATYNIVDGVVELPDDGNYLTALIPFGYEPIPSSAEELAAAHAQMAAAEEDARIAAEEAAAKEEAERLAAEEAAAADAAEKEAAATKTTKKK